MIPLSPPQKKEPLGLLSFWRRECIIRNNFFPCTYFIIYICFFLHYGFCAAHQVCALSAQTCAPCAFENAQVCDPTLSATKKKEPLGLLFCGGESGIRTHEALYGGLHDFESCAFNRAPPSLQLRLPFNNTLFYPDCKAFILTFQPLCLICHFPLYRRRYLPLFSFLLLFPLFLVFPSIFFISFYFLYAHYIF